MRANRSDHATATSTATHPSSSPTGASRGPALEPRFRTKPARAGLDPVAVARTVRQSEGDAYLDPDLANGTTSVLRAAAS